MPNGLPGQKTRETLTKEEVDTVLAFERWCQRRGLALDLICRHCVDAGHGKASRVVGDNRPDSTAFHMTCAHADRIYGDAAPRK